MNKGLITLSVEAMPGLYTEKEAIKLAKDAGADGVDFSLLSRGLYNSAVPDSIYAKSDEELYEHFKDLGDYARSIGLIVGQVHGKSSGFKNIPEEDEIMVENIRKDILATKAMGAPICVVHTTTNIYMGANPDPKLMRELNFQQFTRTLPYAKEQGIILATETFGDAVRHACCDFFGQADEFIKGFNRVAAFNNYEYADNYAICADTGHSNKAARYNQPKPGDVIRMCGRHVKALHLNDNNSFIDQHQYPGAGTIDWKDVFDALEEIGYSGTYNLELHLDHYGPKFMPEYAAFSVKVLRELLRQRGI